MAPTTAATDDPEKNAELNQSQQQQQQKQTNQIGAPTEAQHDSKWPTKSSDQVQESASGEHDERVLSKVRFSQEQIDEELLEMVRRAKQHKKWNRRLKIFFCCLGYKKNKDSIADIASIFAEFYSDLNLPSSDLAAGFVLLAKYQEAQRQWILKHQKNNKNGDKIEQFLSGVSVTDKTKFLDIKTAEDSHLVNDLIYYMNYSLAIFGWPLQMVENPCTLCCIYPYLRPAAPCTSSRRRRSSQVSKQDKEAADGDGNHLASGLVGDDLAKGPVATDDAGIGDKKKKRKKSKDKQAKSDSSEEKRLTSEEEVGSSQASKVLVADEKQKGKSSKAEEKKHKVPEVGRLDEDCDRPIILEDNCCSCNLASAGRRLAAHNYEIIYVSYRVAVNVVPFLVAADHAKQTVVVAIRGSMSLSDMVTDMNGTVDKLPIENCPDDWLCHRGIARAANYVKTTLNDEHILDRAFNCRPDLGSQEYDLMLCGHSLGAGAAAILGVLMRPQFPNLKAYLYAPPGGILSLPVVEYTKQFATGIILGNDTVPRLGVAQLERLKYHVLLSLKTSDKSTSKILAKAICPTMCFGTNKVEYDPAQSLDLLYGTEANPFEFEGNRIPFQVQEHVLYVPGRLIHVVKNHSFKSKTPRLFKEPIYQAIWTENQDYDRIMIGKGMLFDHLPQNLMHSMKMLFTKTLPGRRESKLSQQQHVGVISSAPNGIIEPSATKQQPLQGEISSKIVLQVGGHLVCKDIGDESINNNDSDHDNDENNNKGSEELRRKLYPQLNAHSASIERLHHQPQVAAPPAEGIKQLDHELDENGNEKTSL